MDMRLARSAIGLVMVVAACGSGVVQVSGGPATTSTASRAASVPSASPSDGRSERRQDLDQLLEWLIAWHPNPFLDEGETAFRARFDAIAASADRRTDSGFLIDVMRLMGHRDRDGHSGAWALAQHGSVLHAWPVWLREFSDGMRIVAARAPHEDLVGGVVTAVGGTPIDQAREAVIPLVPADNDSNRRATLPMYLLLPEVIEDLGLQRPGAAALTVTMTDGTTIDVTPDPLPIDSFRDWIFGVYHGGFPESMPPDEHGSHEQRHRDRAFWTETLPDGTLYVGYHQVQARDPGGQTLSDLADAVESAASGVVVDLRANGGGDNNTYGPLVDAIETRAKADPRSVALLTSRDTFSAAGNFVTVLKVGDQRDGILLVGEPPGGGLDMYGDINTVTLKHSGVVVLISTRYHEKAPGDDRLQIEPDVPVEASWADVVAGRDPVLDDAVERVSAR